MRITEKDVKIIRFILLILFVITFVVPMYLFLHSPIPISPVIHNDASPKHARLPVLKRSEKKLDCSQTKFVTVVMPSVVNPKGRNSRLEAIDQTWGDAANSLYVVNSADAYTVLDEVTANRDKILIVPADMDETAGVRRLNHVIQTVFHDTNPEFAFFVNDHTFVIPHHLCQFLSGKDPNAPMYVGHALKSEDKNFAFNSGASGYILSRRTMSDLVEKWLQNDDEHCVSRGQSKWFEGNPGLVTAKCLHESLRVGAEDTRDETGAHRFHAFGLTRVVRGDLDEWYVKKHKTLDFSREMPLLSVGKECCSKETISFHYVEYSETRALYELMRRLCVAPSVAKVQVKEWMLELWPDDKEKGWLGHYAKGLPNKKDSAEWDNIISVVLTISKGNKCTSEK